VSEPNPDGKPFGIDKWLMLEAWRRVKDNKGTWGIDEQSIEEFESDLQGNLYKLWNRMSSGSYMPPPVRAVEIPKKSGGSRMLGVPTVTAYHKVAQAGFGFAGRDAPISPALRRAVGGAVRSPHRRFSHL